MACSLPGRPRGNSAFPIGSSKQIYSAIWRSNPPSARIIGRAQPSASAIGTSLTTSTSTVLAAIGAVADVRFAGPFTTFHPRL